MLCIHSVFWFIPFQKKILFDGCVDIAICMHGIYYIMPSPCSIDYLYIYQFSSKHRTSYRGATGRIEPVKDAFQ